MDVQLYNGDCLEVMPWLTDGCADMILCDLPYGTTKNKWDSVIDLNLLWAQYKRVIKKNGAIVLFAQTPFDKILGCSNLEWLRYEWIWEKPNGSGHLNAKKMPLKIHENILVFYDELPTYNPQMRTGFKPYKALSGQGSSNYGDQKQALTVSNGTRYPVDILQYNRDKSKLHPTQKPVALLEYLIRTYTNVGETVLDNTMGSGSTGEACMNTGRRFIGIEKDCQYFELAKTRIEDAKRQAEDAAE